MFEKRYPPFQAAEKRQAGGGLAGEAKRLVGPLHAVGFVLQVAADVSDEIDIEDPAVQAVEQLFHRRRRRERVRLCARRARR